MRRSSRQPIPKKFHDMELIPVSGKKSKFASSDGVSQGEELPQKKSKDERSPTTKILHPTPSPPIDKHKGTFSVGKDVLKRKVNIIQRSLQDTAQQSTVIEILNWNKPSTTKSSAVSATPPTENLLAVNTPIPEVQAHAEQILDLESSAGNVKTEDYSSNPVLNVVKESVELAGKVGVNLKGEGSPEASNQKQVVIGTCVVNEDGHGESVVTEHNQVQISSIGSSLGSTVSNGFRFQCPYCKYSTDKRENWYKHRKIHLGNGKYPCEECKYVAKSLSNLKRHLQTHSDVKLFKCDICEQRFRQKAHLQRHTKFMHQTKTQKCPLCNYVTVDIGTYIKQHLERRHNVVETPEGLVPINQYNCGECGMQFASLQDLNQHIKFHKGGPEIKLFCELCSFVTDCESRLKRHKMMHSGERPFHCEFCSYKAQQKVHLKRHLLRLHKNESKPGPEKPQAKSISEQASPQEMQLQDLSLQPGLLSCLDTDSNQGHAVSSMSSTLAANDPSELEAVDMDNSKVHEQSKEGRILAANKANNTITVESAIPTGDVGNMSKVNIINHKGTGIEVESSSVINIDSNVIYVNQSSTDTTSTFDKNSMQSINPDSHVPNEILVVKTKKGSNLLSRDFMKAEKYFPCEHCTMKFNKLINLYKHIQVQHSEVKTTSQSNNGEMSYFCVMCPYKATRWANLLVHMRRHTQQKEIVEHHQSLFCCQICVFTTWKRSSLFSHMMKEHKVQIVLQEEDEDSAIFEQIIDDGGNQVIEVVDPGEIRSLVKHTDMVVKLEDGVNWSSQDTQSTSQVPDVNWMPAQVSTSDDKNQSQLDQDAACAIQGLHALACQPPIMTEGQQENIPESDNVSDKLTASGGKNDSEITIENAELVPKKEVALSSTAESGVVIERLEIGDYIEINGETYKVT